MVRFVRARAPCVLLAGGRAICYTIPPPILPSNSIFPPFPYPPYGAVIWPLESLIPLEEEDKHRVISPVVFAGLRSSFCLVERADRQSVAGLCPIPILPMNYIFYFKWGRYATL